MSLARFGLDPWPTVPHQPTTAIGKEAEARRFGMPIRNSESSRVRTRPAKARYNSSPEQFPALAPDAISPTGLSRERQWENVASLLHPIQTCPKTFGLAYCRKHLDK